jgi:LPS O-antigen subunit length determinant protein (WzzB/FepE family)
MNPAIIVVMGLMIGGMMGYALSRDFREAEIERQCPVPADEKTYY